MTTEKINALESVLFISGEALSFVYLQKILGIEKEALSELLKKYANVLQEREGALVLVVDSKSARLVVANQYTSFVEDLAKSEIQESLSKAALEVLALVAYLAPVSRADIDATRGVNSSFTLRNLSIRGLIERKGNPADARGYVYEPSMQFLTTLGMGTIEDLPGYQDLRNDDRLKVLQGKIVLPETTQSDTYHEEA